MSELLDAPPYAERDDELLLRELEALTQHHRQGCPPYARLTEHLLPARTIAELPFVHVGLFKHVGLQTELADAKRERVLESSSTSGTASRIQLDSRSSELQARSSSRILADFLGTEPRPLLVLDSAKALRRRGAVSARIAAAMSLRFLASGIDFVLDDDEETIRWDRVRELCEGHDELVVYGFSWMLWSRWAATEIPAAAREALARTTVRFVHSGGWKKLEDARVERERFDATLLAPVREGSTVLDYYGLVEQIGIVYPTCAAGFRHAPRWAEVLVRDTYSLEVLEGEPGQLQLLNPLAWGAPYHSVLTEDQGIVVPGPCPCGRAGRRFHLLGRLPRAEVRGCSNV